MNKLNIIFEDNELLVINKPAGLVVHEGNGPVTSTLVDLLAHHLPKSSLKANRYGLLHRLDKDTSGIILIAKTRDNFNYLQTLFRQRQIHKEYLVLVHGHLTPKRGIIKIPLSRDLIKRTQIVPHASGKIAETSYAVTSYYKGFTYLRAQPATGRTHQIRVHFSSLGYPVVGDKTYGKPDSLPRQFLHAHKISFVGLLGKRQTFTAPLPDDLTHFLNGLK